MCIYIYVYTYVCSCTQNPTRPLAVRWFTQRQIINPNPPGEVYPSLQSLPGTQNRWELGVTRPLFEVPEPSTHIILSWTPFSSNSMERFSENDRHRETKKLNFPNGCLIFLGMRSTLRVFRMSHLKTTTQKDTSHGASRPRGLFGDGGHFCSACHFCGGCLFWDGCF